MDTVHAPEPECPVQKGARRAGSHREPKDAASTGQFFLSTIGPFQGHGHNPVAMFFILARASAEDPLKMCTQCSWFEAVLFCSVIYQRSAQMKRAKRS